MDDGGSFSPGVHSKQVPCSDGAREVLLMVCDCKLKLQADGDYDDDDDTVTVYTVHTDNSINSQLACSWLVG